MKPERVAQLRERYATYVDYRRGAAVEEGMVTLPSSVLVDVSELLEDVDRLSRMVDGMPVAAISFLVENTRFTDHDSIRAQTVILDWLADSEGEG